MGRLFFSDNAMAKILSGALQNDVLIDVDPDRGVFEAVSWKPADQLITSKAPKGTKLLRGKTRRSKAREKPKEKHKGKGTGVVQRMRGEKIEAHARNILSKGPLAQAEFNNRMIARGISRTGITSAVGRMVDRGELSIDKRDGTLSLNVSAQAQVA